MQKGYSKYWIVHHGFIKARMRFGRLGNKQGLITLNQETINRGIQSEHESRKNQSSIHKLGNTLLRSLRAFEVLGSGSVSSTEDSWSPDMASARLRAHSLRP